MALGERPPTTTEGRAHVLTSISHGAHVLDDSAAGADRLAARTPSVTTVSAAGLSGAAGDTSPFDYLFDDLAAAWPAHHLPVDDPAAVVTALEALGAAMVEDPPAGPDPLAQPDNSTIPPVYTYWGQFIDHDMTANTDRDSAVSDITASPFVPRAPAFVRANLENLRQPQLNLDSLYGDGPTFDPAHPTEAAALYDGISFVVGEVAEVADPGKPPLAGVPVAPVGDLAHDLPRGGTTARIADARNDENLIIAQLHVAFLRFHNAVVDWVRANEHPGGGERGVFRRARRLTRWHYQWLVANDFLRTVALTGVADHVLFSDDPAYRRRHGRAYMPLEHSVAAYRFGHSMVRGSYDYNRNFGRPGTNVLPNASFGLLFAFTGKATPPFFGATQALPFNWVIEWERFVDRGSALPDHFARRIDTRLAPPLRDLANEGTGAAPPIALILRRLATRNLLRGYLLGIPTGQAVAAALGVTPLTATELQRGNSVFLNEALAAGGFLERTPLWFYVLKEAEVRANGSSLGEVGSRIVCETIIGQLREDPASYLNVEEGWAPADGVRLPNGDAIVSIADLLRFAGVLA